MALLAGKHTLEDAASGSSEAGCSNERDVDPSSDAAGAVLKQRVEDSWMPLSFFSQKLKPAETTVPTVPSVGSSLPYIKLSIPSGIS